MDLFSKQDIINTAINNLGGELINVEIQGLAQTKDSTWRQMLNWLNSFFPEVRIWSGVPISTDNGRNGYIDIPPYFTYSKNFNNGMQSPNDPQVIIYAEPVGMSWFERNLDFGLLTLRQGIYYLEPGTDAMLLSNFKARRQIYGIQWNWFVNPTNRFRVYFDDFGLNYTKIAITWLNRWNEPDTSGTTGFLYSDAANYAITFMQSKFMQTVGFIRRKLAGGNREAILDGERMVDDGKEMYRDLMEEVANNAFMVGYIPEN